MKKRNSKEKDIKTSKSTIRCTLCLCKTITKPIQNIAMQNIKKKYYYPQIETYYYRSANNIIYDSYSKQAIELVESNKIISTEEFLKNYFSFTDTVQQIKLVIHRRIEKDFYGWIDFQKDHFFITNNYYIRRKNLVQNNKKMQKYFKNSSMQSTGSGDDKNVRQYFENKLKKQLDNERIVKLRQNDTNRSEIQIKRLTKNLEQMIVQLADLSMIKTPAFERNVKSKKKLFMQPQNNISQIFKLNNCADISVINKNIQMNTQSPISLHRPNVYQESYGLESIRHKNPSKLKKSSKLALRSIDKFGGGLHQKLFPQTPKARFFHGQNQYQEVQSKVNCVKVTKKYSKDRTPMSPGNNRSDSLKSSKTLKNEKNQIHMKRK